MQLLKSTGRYTIALAAITMAIGNPGTALADPQNPPPLPTHVVAPPSGKGVGYSQDKALPANYVEEEYLVSGKANIYTHDAKRQLVVQDAAQSYTTRIIVRYPRDRKAFSGNVIFDLSHPEGASETLWAFSKAYITRSHDAYVAVTTKREPRNPLFAKPSTPIELIKSFDPVRYGPIDFKDGGLTWDIIAQVGRLVKSNVPANPLRNYLPQRMVMGGYSGSGALTLFYINEGFANKARMPGGRPIFDAYIVGEPSWYPRVNSKIDPATDDIPIGDIRTRVAPRDVPAISLYSMAIDQISGKDGPIRPDSDAADDRYRLYIVTGASHAGDLVNEGAGLIKPRQCEHPASDVPLRHQFALVLDQLKQWSAGTVVPPHGSGLEKTTEGKAVRDAVGNPKGGVRTTKLDVPSSRYLDDAGPMMCQAVGAREPLSAEEMRQLYGTPANYVAKVRESAARLVQERWLLPADVQEIITAAQAVTF